MNTRARLTLALAIVVAPHLAHADEVNALGGKVVEIDARVQELGKKLRPPPEPGPEIAERRLIDAQVLYELKNYEAASMILLDVVDKYTKSSAYPEAVYYLADSLFLKRDFLSSRRFFERVIENPKWPHYQEALQRLIELSLHIGDYSNVDSYIAKLEALSGSKRLPSVPYVKGKYFFFRQQYDKALEALKGLGPNDEYYFHGLYFIGASQVAMGPAKAHEALGTFFTILKAEAKTDAQKRIAELAHMALARLYLDQGQLTNSLEEYGKISPKSEVFNDALYESAWASIKGKDFVKASRALDLLLLNAPDSQLAPEVKLLLGSLRIRQEQYGPATESFTKTRDEYAPLQKLLEDELAKTGNGPAYFRDLITKNLGKFDTAAILPASAVKWLKNEPTVVHVATLIGDIANLRKSLDESEEIVRRLERALSGPARINVFPELAQARTRAIELSTEMTQVRKQLAEKEALLIGPVVGAEKAQLDKFNGERAALEEKLAKLPAKTEVIADRQNKARTAFNELDRRAVEMRTELVTLRNGFEATKKLYLETIAKKPANERPEELKPPATAASTAGVVINAKVGYSEQQAELARRLNDLKDPMTQAKTHLEQLKTMVIDGHLQEASRAIPGSASEIEGLEGKIEGIRKGIEDAASAVGVDDAEMQLALQLKGQYDDLLKRQHGLTVEVRSRLSPPDRSRAEQIESILDRARTVEQNLIAFNARIDEMLNLHLKDIQASLAEEKGHVATYREVLARCTGESAEVGGGVIAESFKQVANRFYNVVVRSDVGIIDVAWALKDSTTRKSNNLVAERKRELKLFDDEFKEVLKE